jgi:2-keto-4-pentenoate hydratase/2-oxohepta-3-ene-1,7-dioic acid hydratase in catechol pathway
MKKNKSVPEISKGLQILFMTTLINDFTARPILESSYRQYNITRKKLGNFNSAIKYIKLKDQLKYAKKLHENALIKLTAGIAVKKAATQSLL